jgi:Rad3-related DNA helicase
MSPSEDIQRLVEYFKIGRPDILRLSRVATRLTEEYMAAPSSGQLLDDVYQKIENIVNEQGKLNPAAVGILVFTPSREDAEAAHAHCRTRYPEIACLGLYQKHLGLDSHGQVVRHSSPKIVFADH